MRFSAWPLLGIGALAQATEPPAVGGVVGTVTTTRPAIEGTLPVTQDGAVCGEAAPDERLRVVDGKLANAVVWLEGVAVTEAPAPIEATLDQQRCVYVPHVQAAPKGSKLTVVNSDAVLHNAHSTLGTRTVFNVAMPDLGQRITSDMRRAGLVEVKCDAGHDWMSAYIWVFEHPYYAVTGADGAFSITDVPPGSYTLKVWHEELGTVERPVEVGAEGAPLVVALE